MGVQGRGFSNRRSADMEGGMFGASGGNRGGEQKHGTT